MAEDSRRRVKTQEPRDYTVQIRVAGTEKIVGTGIVLDANRVVTCAHVVEAAGVDPRIVQGDQVDVYYPKATGGRDEKTRAARVDACFEGYDDDVVLLALEENAPIGPEQYAELGYAESSAGNPFRAYGYKRLEGEEKTYHAGYAFGVVLGCVECPEGFVLQADPVELDSKHLAQGMSGAGVLDMERNLVVGLVSEVYYAADDKNRDVGWAVDARVLTFNPLNLLLAQQPRPREEVAAPPELPDPRLALLRPAEPMALHGAPPVLEEWVGRDDLLADLTGDWRSPETTMTALVGFGGEGKSSLARQWIEQVTGQRSKVEGGAPEWTFWWSFYDDPSVEAFFEALLDYLSGGEIGPRDVPSASARMKLAARMLRGGRYLLVLDGFEVMQHQEGDDYGLVRSADLRNFLEYLAAPPESTKRGETDKPSFTGPFILITSRAPVLDLLPYTTATQRDVTRLSPADGWALLRALGVKGPDRELNRVVRAWDGHALTLSLLGGLLAEQHDGDVAHLRDLPQPLENEDRYERVHRVLRRYDEHLTAAEREFLKVFSVFRTPVHRSAFEKVFRNKGLSDDATTRLSDREFDALIRRLVTYRILRYSPQDETYTTHPLIRNHYFALFMEGKPSQTQATHDRVKEVYLELAGDTPKADGTSCPPTLDDLRPLIEVVHHACRAGAYDEAWKIYSQRIQQVQQGVLVHQLGAYETDLSVLHEFYPRTLNASAAGTGDPDLTDAPQVSEPKGKSWILNEVGFCLMNLGRLREAVSFYERSNAMDVELGDWHNASIGYQNLASLHIYLGGPSTDSGQGLEAGAEAAREALRLARKAGNPRDGMVSLAWLAWAEHLRGETEAALAHFAEAETLEKLIDSRKQYLYSLRGIQHADALIRSTYSSFADPSLGLGTDSFSRSISYARRITEANLEEWVSYSKWPKDESSCHRVLGDIDAMEGHHAEARVHYDEALRIARTISYRPALIEALLARGRYIAKDLRDFRRTRSYNIGDLDQAFSDLREALDLATRGSYRRYEADIRVALAWAYRAQGHPDRARVEAERARAMSEAMGYHWGRVDAEEVLDT